MNEDYLMKQYMHINKNIKIFSRTWNFSIDSPSYSFDHKHPNVKVNKRTTKIYVFLFFLFFSNFKLFEEMTNFSEC